MSKDDENVDTRFINFNNVDDNTFTSKNSLDDNDLSDFNKERLKFYVELNKTVKNNPKILKNIINKYNSVTKRKVYEKGILKNIKNIKSKVAEGDENFFEDIRKNLKDEDTISSKASEQQTVSQQATPAPQQATPPQAAPGVAAPGAATQQAAATSGVEAATGVAATLGVEAPAATQQAVSQQAVSNVAAGVAAASQSGGKKIRGGALDFQKYISKDNNSEELIKKYKDSDKASKKKLIKELKKEYTLNNVTEEDDDRNFLDDVNPMQKFINEYYNANQEYNREAAEADKDADKKTKETKKQKAEETLKTKIVKAVEEFDNDPMNSLDILAIKNDDRIVFIVITFVIRYITLLLINWCVEIDIIRSFNQAFILFSFIYIIIFWLIVMIINVNISPEYSGESSIMGKVQSVLYYFHFRINDIGRLLVHTLLIIILLIIPIIIKKEQKKDDQPLTYDERVDLYKTLSLFTIFMWIFTSIIASKY